MLLKPLLLYATNLFHFIVRGQNTDNVENVCSCNYLTLQITMFNPSTSDFSYELALMTVCLVHEASLGRTGSWRRIFYWRLEKVPDRRYLNLHFLAEKQ